MAKKIILYCDPDTYFSDLTAKWLKDHNFEFQVKNVREESIQSELFKVSEQYAVPVVMVGRKVIIGFNEVELSGALLEK
ncbi:MAG: hypothetical protein G01um101419_52 [Parcubacteria group bacterium Gr01-1014_19]|nr:MAG: hypothetical protein G01um101419_52 [Parcubacteria group bacterium Gr01-1014_19]